MMGMSSQQKRFLKAIHANDVHAMRDAERGVHSFWFGFQEAASPYFTLKDNSTTLMHACKSEKTLAAVKYLLERRVNVNHQNLEGNTALMYAVRAGNLDIVKILVEAGADINIKNHKYGETALMMSCHAHITKYLLSLPNIMMDVVDHDGNTALIHAVRRNGKTSLELLLEAGANIQVKNNSGRTALHAATLKREENPAIVEILVSHGLSVYEQDNKAYTPISYSTNGLVKEILRAAAKKERPPEKGAMGIFVDMLVQEVKVAAGLPAAITIEPANSHQERIRAAMEDEGLDPTASEQWLPIGDAAIEYIQADQASPRVLRTLFNFQARHYATTVKNLLNGENTVIANGKIEDFSNPDLVSTAHIQLKKMGKKPPEYTVLRKD